MRVLIRSAVIAFVLVCCVGCDQVSKTEARVYLPGTGIHSYLGDTFRLQYAENPGAFLSRKFLAALTTISRSLNELADFTVWGEWLHGDGLQELQRALLSGIWDRRHLEGHRRGGAGRGLAGIAHDGG